MPRPVLRWCVLPVNSGRKFPEVRSEIAQPHGGAAGGGVAGVDGATGGMKVLCRAAGPLPEPGGSDWRAGAVETAHPRYGRAGAQRRADPPSGLREARSGGPGQRQLPQRRDAVDHQGRARRGRDRGAPGSQSHIRAVVGGQAPDAVYRLRRQDSVDVRTRGDDARNPGSHRRGFRRAGKSGADFRSHRRGAGGGHGVAEPAAGADRTDGVSGRADGEDEVRRAGG